MSDTWTHKLARIVARRPIGTGAAPNHPTTLRLLTGMAACLFLVLGPLPMHGAAVWGGALWVLSAFLDRVDSELARLGNMMTPCGHRCDYMVDNGVNCLFFVSIGIGLRHATLFGRDLGHWPIVLGILSSAALLPCNWMSEIDETRTTGAGRIHEGAWGFHPDDALYLLGPAAWLGRLLPILLGAAAGTSRMAAIIAIRLRHLFHPVSAATR